MRPYLAVSLLLWSLLLSESQATNGGAGDQVMILCKDGHCSSGTMKKRVASVSKKSHHWLPFIHEDYYGPRSHRPRHH
ncbi:hypothetical protein I3760_14G133800 [Carya illinoinensis]|nr:hypothetical protein I3760_14G133800 [Carya illinoinensis]